MTPQQQDVITQAYTSFNARDVDTVLSLMHTDVHWPNGWEGGYVNGHDEVRDYWTRQWKEINPTVEPVTFKDRGDGRLEVEVHQIAKDLHGTVLFDGIVLHVYAFEDGLIKNMEIEKQ